ncbi:uncharacterized protein LOC144148040 [Haemaphysalis longicornis]
MKKNEMVERRQLLRGPASVFSAYSSSMSGRRNLFLGHYAALCVLVLTLPSEGSSPAPMPRCICFIKLSSASFGSAVEEDPWRVLDHSRRYLACWFGACGPACAFCARVRPGSRVGVSLRPVEYSPFLVGVEWQRLLPGAPRSFATALRKHGPMSRYRLGVTTCWSAKDVHCTFRCGPEETVMLAGSAGSFSVPADLYSRTVLIQVRSLGSKSSAFKAAFHRRRAEPDPPCDATVRTLSWSAVRIRWTASAHRVDGFHVKWCRAGSLSPRACSGADLPRNASSVVLKGLAPFIRYKYTVRSFRKTSNGTGVLYSSSSVASRRSRLSFELFLYAEMLMIFALGAALTLMAMLTVGYVVIRALGLRRFFVMEDAELVAPPGGARENRGEGDHRRHIVGAARRRRGAALRRINSHGDS